MEILQGKEAEYQKYVEINSADSYSAAVVGYGELWASLMEQQIGAESDSKKVARIIAEVAEKTSHAADVEGITGFMYGAAVSALSHFWKHGEILRRWHNKHIQIGDEGDRANESGGVLNPALLSIG